MIILWIIFAILSCIVGSKKGYNGVGCFFAGLIGGIITFIVMLFLPDKHEEEEYARAQQDRERRQETKIRELQRQVDEVAELKKRINELEAAQKAAEAPSGSQSEHVSET